VNRNRNHDLPDWASNRNRCLREIDRLLAGDREFFEDNPDRRLCCREFIEGELPPEAKACLPDTDPSRSHGCSATPASIKSACVASMVGRC